MKMMLKMFFFVVLITAAALPQKKVTVSLDGKAWKGELHSAQVSKLFNKSFLKLHFVSGREELSIEVDMANLGGKSQAQLTYKPMKRLSDPSPSFTVSYFENELDKWVAVSGTLSISQNDETKNLLSGELDAKLERKAPGNENKQPRSVKVTFANVKYLK